MPINLCAPEKTPIYLNNAATSWPKPPGVAQAVAEAIDACPAVGHRQSFARKPDTCPLGPTVQECREQLARLLQVSDPFRICITANVTHALNVAIWGLCRAMPVGAHIVTSVAEHNSVLRPLRHLQRWRPDIRVTYIELDAQGHLSETAFRDAIQPGIALAVLTHASNVTGRIYEVAPLFRLAKAAGACTLLDSAQSIGHIPVHPDDLAADIVAFTGHKGLYGLPGIGGLYVAPGIELEPLLVGGTGADSDLEEQPEQMPTRLEAGTPNIPAMAGLLAALRWREREGAAFEQRHMALAIRLRDTLRAMPGITIFDDAPADEWLGIISFTVAGCGVEDVGRKLFLRQGVICRTGLHCAPRMHAALGTGAEGTIRLSPSGFTTDEEIDKVISALARITARVSRA
ncbi:MAG: aminotransferase class V-fold PLP-dependent enzyme [bacterium]